MTGNPGFDKIILGANGLIVLAATALTIYSHTFIRPSATNEDLEFSGMVQDSMRELQKPQIQFPEMVINLYSRESRLRFLNLKMTVATFEQSQNQTVESAKPLIQDVLIDIASNMEPQELNSVTGRILLEARIKKKANAKLPEPAIKKIYFSKFIVQ